MYRAVEICPKFLDVLDGVLVLTYLKKHFNFQGMQLFQNYFWLLAKRGLL